LNDIFFFTSNRTKLAHFKYIAQSLGLQIAGFRERTYRAPYEEPRIDDRDVLLKQSYEDALTRWRKQNRDDNSFFFLEDTSVRIEALSLQKETPGVDVKYWMQSVSYASLDHELKVRGNNRLASVRSDIVLHVPARFREALRISTPFVHAFAITKGTIVEATPSSTRSLVFPWLDNRTFNSWFVPEGSNKPMSALAISDADRFDFRAKAFRAAFEQFMPYGGIRSERVPSHQLPIGTVPRLPVLVVCGYSCAGKSTIARKLCVAHNFIHIEASDFMRRAFWQRHGLRSKTSVGDFAEEALRVDPGIAAVPIAEEIARLGYPAVVVTGFRSKLEVEVLRNELELSRAIHLVFVQARTAVRLQRAFTRDNLTEPAFEQRFAQEKRMGLDGLSKVANSVINNNGNDVDDFARTFLTANQEQIVEASALCANAPRVFANGGLEETILLTLLEHGDEAITTTQIAQKAKQYFGIAKSKNNVSRYFNQDFHPYFESKTDRKRNLYYLSGTGRSLAGHIRIGSAHRHNEGSFDSHKSAEKRQLAFSF
jgi:dephospho-CoA kinase/inosine/xanthosine triphosphate pyrophosphatase family protein